MSEQTQRLLVILWWAALIVFDIWLVIKLGRGLK